METLDIVKLIEKNPIIRLNKTYENKFIHKITKNFNEKEQQMFAASFYSFLNYSKTDFIIDLDLIWNWLGYTRSGGYNKEIILMNVNTNRKANNNNNIILQLYLTL